jgi:hypothetical protein
VDEIQITPDHRTLNELCQIRVHIVQGASAVVACRLAFAWCYCTTTFPVIFG